MSLASKGSRIAEKGRDARGRENNTTIVRMDKLPTGSMPKNSGWGANLRPESNSDSLQFPIVLLALGVGLRRIGRVYPTLPYPILMGRVGCGRVG